MVLQFLISNNKIDTYYYQKYRLNKNNKLSFFIKKFENNFKEKIKVINNYFFILIKVLSLGKIF